MIASIAGILMAQKTEIYDDNEKEFTLHQKGVPIIKFRIDADGSEIIFVKNSIINTIQTYIPIQKKMVKKLILDWFNYNFDKKVENITVN